MGKVLVFSIIGIILLLIMGVGVYFIFFSNNAEVETERVSVSYCKIISPHDSFGDSYSECINNIKEFVQDYEEVECIFDGNINCECVAVSNCVTKDHTVKDANEIILNLNSAIENVLGVVPSEMEAKIIS